MVTDDAPAPPFGLRCPRCERGIRRFADPLPKYLTCGICGVRSRTADWQRMSKGEVIEQLQAQHEQTAVRSAMKKWERENAGKGKRG